MTDIPTNNLRFVRRKVFFEGGAEPAFRLILQQRFDIIDTTGPSTIVGEDWRDVPTVNEPDPVPVEQGVSLDNIMRLAS